MVSLSGKNKTNKKEKQNKTKKGTWVHKAASAISEGCWEQCDGMMDNF